MDTSGSRLVMKLHTRVSTGVGEGRKSKWMGEVMKQMFRSMIIKMRVQETKNRVMVIRRIRKELRRRFMNVHRLFKEWKYG